VCRTQNYTRIALPTVNVSRSSSCRITRALLFTNASVTTVNGTNKIVVTAEIHAEPRMHSSVPDMTKLECTNKETDVTKTTARTYGKTGRVAHASISPVTDTGPCVRRRSLPANPAPKPRAVELKASSASLLSFLASLLLLSQKLNLHLK